MTRKIIAAALFLLAAGLLPAQTSAIPAGENEEKARLNGSPRHGEWVTYQAEGGDQVEAWVVFPERKNAAPVVVVVHENRGLNDWARAVADQLAAEGFIAIAPDFISGKAPGGGGTRTVDPDAARDLIGKLTPDEITRRLRGAVRYATALPAASKNYGVVGFCWGGAVSFSYATADAALGAAVVFYGTSPRTEALRGINAPVLGLYGGADNRVNATIGPAAEEMKRLGKRYEVEIYDGAGHAFLRSQAGQNGANMAASQKGWPRTVEFLKRALENKVSLGESGGTPLRVIEAVAISDDDCGDDCAVDLSEAAGGFAKN
jgi:carboxymethylenebutenolidase